MDKATLEKQIDLAAARYAKNKDPAIRTEIDQLSQRLVEFRHLATLQNALERCRFEDVQTPEVNNALSELAKLMPDPLPIRQFASAVADTNEDNPENRQNHTNYKHDSH